MRLLLVAWQVNMDNKWLLLSEFIFRATLVAVAIASICVRFGLLEVSCGRTVKLAGGRAPRPRERRVGGAGEPKVSACGLTVFIDALLRLARHRLIVARPR